MTPDRTDEIMMEVRKLQDLIEECCPEVFRMQDQEIPDRINIRKEMDALNRHRLSILSEAIDSKKTVD